MPDFSVRSTLLEKMDEPDIPEHELRQNLRELETVNTLLGGYSVVLNALSRMQWGSEPVRIMDMGCGGGDLVFVPVVGFDDGGETLRLGKHI